MARVTPQEYAEKWARRTGAATADYTKGINRVTVAPGQAAADKQEKMMVSLMEAIQSGKWARRVSGVSLQSWKDSAINKGAGRITAGVNAAQADMARFAQESLAFIDTIRGEIDGMPDTTIEDRIARSAHFQRRMHDFERS